MVWIPLRERLHQLPLVLAGPILRRTEPASVTVWLALRRSCDVKLQIYATHQADAKLAAIQLQGQRSTVAVGQHLHIVAVTASVGQALQPGQIYAYDLIFEIPNREPQRLRQALNTDQAPLVPISYFEHGLPTFLLPPTDVNDLKILHGSCRKTHGGGIDALVILDDLLEQSAQIPQQRPQQLFCTGDQIYGDDVCDPWLFALTDAGDTLLGWEEDLPIDQIPSETVPPLKSKHLPPGERSSVAENLAGFTAGMPNKSNRTNSHLFSFGEYCTAYLFAWSPILWPKLSDFPTGRERYRAPKLIKIWDEEVTMLQKFWQPLWKVRRSLANIATYMVFDDHDVSDDWYLNQDWCLRVLGKPLGYRVVQNALLAYALAQGWGNTPEQFEPGQRGERLLNAAVSWSAASGSDATASATIAQLVGLPETLPDGQPQFRRDQQVWILDHHPDSLHWHYQVQSACHEVVVLDSRTWRGYPIAAQNLAPPRLLCHIAFEQQIRLPLRQSQAQNLLTLVVAPTNLIHLRLIDWAQQWSLKQGKVFDNDVGDAWNLHKEALSEFLGAMFESRERLVVLSGDIHYGFAARLNYWTGAAEAIQTQGKDRAQVLMQLTSSAFKNAEFKTQLVQTKLKSLLPETPQEWAGWHQMPELWEVKSQLIGKHWQKRPPQTDLPIQPLKLRPFQKPAWELAAAQPESLPDWQYRVEWIHRQPARSLPWGKVGWLKAQRPRGWLARHRHWLWHRLSWLWRNRWLQEGSEVVGTSNLGLVQFRDFATDPNSKPGLDKPPIVIQDLYWSPPWQPTQLVTSRFEGRLYPDENATPFPLLPRRLAAQDQTPAAPVRHSLPPP